MQERRGHEPPPQSILERLREDVPQCTRECGIVLEDPRILEFERQLESMQEPPPPAVTCDPVREVYDELGRVIVFTDGACKRPRMSTLRRAGSGCFYGVGHPANFGLPFARCAANEQQG